MKCTIGVSGGLTKEFDVSSPQDCRMNGALFSLDNDGKKTSFTTVSDKGIEVSGTGVAEGAGVNKDGDSCAKVTLANGRSGNICASPSRAP